MRIQKLLQVKGDFVATVGPDAAVWEALDELAHRGVGALVVSADGRHPDGIISERDIARRLADRGAGILDGPVADIMVRELRCCAPGDEVESLMEVMTTNRIRHIPVVEDEVLVGIVSIGDIVKHRLDELAGDNQALVDYINAR